MVLGGVPDTGIFKCPQQRLGLAISRTHPRFRCGEENRCTTGHQVTLCPKGTLSAVNDRVFIEQGARHKPASQRLVAGVFVAPAVYVVMAFRTCRDKFSEVDAVA
jgi:hypothetical protein